MENILKKLVIISLIFQFLAEGTENDRWRFFDKFIYKIHEMDFIETIVLYRHHRDDNCSLKNWSPLGIPVMRWNELGSIKIRGNYNKNVLAVVCMEKDIDMELINTLAISFDTMRQERILLWVQRPTETFLKEISAITAKMYFLQMIILMIEDNPTPTYYYILHPFPDPQFARIDFENVSHINYSVFYNGPMSFFGKTTIIRASPDIDVKIPMEYKPSGVFPVSRLEDREIIEYALKYNLSLKLMDTNHSAFDIQLNPRFIKKNETYSNVDFMGALSSSTLVVIVPCSSELSFKDAWMKLGMETMLWYVLVVYGAFILVESFVLVMTARISGNNRSLTNLNPFLNLRIFRAILGLPFPEIPRANLSLRQLFLTISLCGFVFSNFVSSKLSSMLTKPGHYSQVSNFEELRESGMTVAMDAYIYRYIVNEIDRDFFKNVVTNAVISSHSEQMKNVLSLNDTYATVSFQSNWKAYDEQQKSRGFRFYCESKDLIIASNLPRTYVLAKNSIHHWLLSRFVMYIQESGITNQWRLGIPALIRDVYNVTMGRNTEHQAVPLSLEQLSWLWYLLFIGYLIATLVFCGEIFLNRNKRRNFRRRVINDSAV
ncbi:hypothetical protein KR009_011082 [Drosophila setifemur]|nr:hypothetical protein KR009_011082 [Drosophila setifemur]